MAYMRVIGLLGLFYFSVEEGPDRTGEVKMVGGFGDSFSKDVERYEFKRKRVMFCHMKYLVINVNTIYTKIIPT